MHIQQHIYKVALHVGGGLWRWVMRLGVIAALSSCATLQVDLDVYKGPLANHEDVQTEQFAILAGAAKPVLEKLEAILIENAKAAKITKKCGQKRLANGARYRKCSQGVEGNWPRLVDQELLNDRKEPVYFVHQVLELYEDDRFNTLVDEVEEYYEAYEEAKASKRWFDGHIILDKLSELLLQLLSEVQSADIAELDREVRTSDIAEALSETLRLRNIAIVAKLKFCKDENDTVVKDFLNKMNQNGSTNYFNCNKKHAFSSLGGYSDTYDRETFQKTVKEFPKLAALALQKIRKASLERIDTSAKTAFPNEHKKLICSGRTTLPMIGAEDGKKHACSEDRPDTADGCKTYLKKAGKLEKTSCPFKDGFGDYRKTYTARTRKSGSDEVNLASLKSFLQSNSAFGRTRLAEGIESRISAYLEASNDCLDAEFGVCNLARERKKLTLSLVRFAQKVVFLADNEALLEIENAAEARKHVRVLQAIGNSILVLADDVVRRDDYRDAFVLEGERSAARGAFTQTPQTRMERLISALNGRKADRERMVLEFNATRDGQSALIEKAVAQIKTEGVTEFPFLAKAPEFTQAADREKFKEWREGWVKRSPAWQPVAVDFADYLKSKVVKDTGQITPKKLKDDIVKELERIKQVFDDDAINDAQIDALPKDAKQRLSKNLAAIKASFGSGWSTVAVSYDKAWTAHQNRLKKYMANDVVKSAVEALENASSATFTVVLALPKTEADVETYKEAAKVVSNIAKDNPNFAAAIDNSTSRIAFYNWLNKRLDALGGDRKPAKAVIVAINEFRPARDIDPSTVVVSNDSENANPAAVMDQLVRELRYAYLVQVEEFGAQDPRAKRLKDALKSAHDFRGGLAYLRPAGTYLRNSYAASTLQKGVSSRWRNTLETQGARALIPFYGALVGGKDSDIVGEIDKQFWQTVNTVRIAGGGRTNYVVAKDDLGNFYVKGVQTDTKDIVKSMQNLALFGIGGQSINLLNRGKDGELIINDDTRPMQAVYAQYEKRYSAATTKTLDSLAVIMTAQTQSNDEAPFKSSLLNKIAAVWSADSDNKAALNSVLEMAASALADEVKKLKPDAKVADEPASPFSAGQRIVDGLHAVRAFGNALEIAIGGAALKPTTEADGASKTQAELQKLYKTQAKKQVASAIKAIIDARKRTVEQFEAGAQVLTEVSQESKKKAAKVEESVAAGGS